MRDPSDELCIAVGGEFSVTALSTGEVGAYGQDHSRPTEYITRGFESPLSERYPSNPIEVVTKSPAATS